MLTNLESKLEEYLVAVDTMPTEYVEGMEKAREKERRKVCVASMKPGIHPLMSPLACFQTIGQSLQVTIGLLSDHRSIPSSHHWLGFRQ